MPRMTTSTRTHGVLVVRPRPHNCGANGDVMPFNLARAAVKSDHDLPRYQLPAEIARGARGDEHLTACRERSPGN
eukprot:8396656-Lingulodinium_polyedra.AAC.1